MGAIGVNLLVGALMGSITEYYTAMGKRPVLSIIRQSSTVMPPMSSADWPLEWNLHSCRSLFWPVVSGVHMNAPPVWRIHCRCRYDGHHCHAAGYRRIRTIADNAGGIAEMSELPSMSAKKRISLDAVGNTAATGKGFAIVSAVTDRTGPVCGLCRRSWNNRHRYL